MVGTSYTHVSTTVFHSHHHAMVLVTNATVFYQHTTERTTLTHLDADKLHQFALILIYSFYLTVHALAEFLDTLVIANDLQYIVRKKHRRATWNIQSVMVANDSCHMHSIAPTNAQLRQSLSAPVRVSGQRNSCNVEISSLQLAGIGWSRIFTAFQVIQECRLHAHTNFPNPTTAHNEHHNHNGHQHVPIPPMR